MSYTVLSFDLDGTLVDTAGEIAEAANRALEDFGVPRRDPARVALLIGAGARALMGALVEQVMCEQPALVGRLPVAQVLERFEQHYARTAGTTSRPYHGCVPALQRLRDGGVRLACLTNKEARYARRVLQAARLDGFFDLVVGGDSLPQRKPQREGIDHVLQRLGGRPEQAAHVGDSHIDVQTARNAGVAAWAVPYGYNAGEPIEAAGPDCVFRDLPAVASHVLAVNAPGPQRAAGRPAPYPMEAA